MSKSVLVINTPSNCKECPINKCKHWSDEEFRPDECDLRPLPKKEVCNEYNFENYTNGFNRGFNRCLEQITPPENIY